jgi:hypothetical protein
MAQTKLPEIIREDIKELIAKCYTQEAVCKFLKNGSICHKHQEMMFRRLTETRVALRVAFF